MEITEKFSEKYGVMCRSDGMIFMPKTQRRKAGWYAGTGTGRNPGYLAVNINGVKYYVHRIIAETFLPRTEGKNFVDHINRDRTDNRLENLRWVNRHENNMNSSQHYNSKHKYDVTLSEDHKRYWRNRARVYRYEKKFGITITIKELDNEPDICKRN